MFIEMQEGSELTVSSLQGRVKRTGFLPHFATNRLIPALVSLLTALTALGPHFPQQREGIALMTCKRHPISPLFPLRPRSPTSSWIIATATKLDPASSLTPSAPQPERVLFALVRSIFAQAVSCQICPLLKGYLSFLCSLSNYFST